MRKYVKDKLEVYLESLIERGLLGTETTMRQFAVLLTEIWDTRGAAKTAAMEVITKLITKHYAALLKSEIVAEFLENSMGECSGFHNSVVDYAPRGGLQFAK